MLCQSAQRPPEDREWRYELKLDGFRAIGRKSGRSTQLWLRNQNDLTRRFPGVVRGIAGLPNDTVLDGEIVAFDEHGRPSFNLLQGLGSAQAIVFYAFDLLMLRGNDVRLLPLEDRRERLREVIPTLPRHLFVIRKTSACAFRGAGGPKASARRHRCQAGRQPIPVGRTLDGLGKVAG